MPIDKFNNYLKQRRSMSQIPLGYMIEILGAEDRAEEVIRIENYKLMTTAVENGRIRGIQVKKLDIDELAEEEVEEENK